MKNLIPENLNKKELFAYLLKNKAVLMQQKKLTAKIAAPFSYATETLTQVNKVVPIAADDTLEDGMVQVKAIINTTNFLDSCGDVHLPGLWKKSLSENKMIMHLQEHDMEFSKIIADGADLKAYTQMYPWKDLGVKKFVGMTEALVFDSTVKEERNKFMYSQYVKGYVKNHSVCMQYVKMVLCINEPEDIEFGAEYEAWQKYIKQVANVDTANQLGYFWAILEAKIIEGSAVPIGANTITPTLEVTTASEPAVATPKKRGAYNLDMPRMKVGKYNLDLTKL